MCILVWLVKQLLVKLGWATVTDSGNTCNLAVRRTKKA